MQLKRIQLATNDRHASRCLRRVADLVHMFCMRDLHSTPAKPHTSGTLRPSEILQDSYWRGRRVASWILDRRGRINSSRAVALDLITR